jgi:hypothetical protein
VHLVAVLREAQLAQEHPGVVEQRVEPRAAGRDPLRRRPHLVLVREVASTTSTRTSGRSARRRAKTASLPARLRLSRTSRPQPRAARIDAISAPRPERRR